jgi:hypothetical protein
MAKIKYFNLTLLIVTSLLSNHYPSKGDSLNTTKPEVINFKIDSIKKELTTEYKVMYAESQKELIGWYEKILGILGLSVSIFGIAVPLAAYYTLSKEKEDLDKYKKGLDKKVKEFIQYSDKKKLESALDDLKSNDLTRIERASRYLSSIYYDFDVSALDTIYNVITKVQLSNPILERFEDILFYQQSTISDKYFIEMLYNYPLGSNRNGRVNSIPFEYLSKYGIEHYKKEICIAFKSDDCQNPRRLEIFIGRFSLINDRVSLLNTKELIDVIDETALLLFINDVNFKHMITGDFKDTYLSQKVKSISNTN